MTHTQIKNIVEAVERIKKIDVCGCLVKFDWAAEDVIEDICCEYASSEGAKLSMSSSFEWPSLDEGDDWQTVIREFPKTPFVEILERQYGDENEAPILYEDRIDVPDFEEESIIQVLLDCKYIRGVGYRWSLALRISF
jgi:hypothetical protein